MRENLQEMNVMKIMQPNIIIQYHYISIYYYYNHCNMVLTPLMQKLLKAKFGSTLDKKQKHTHKKEQQKHALIPISLYYDLRDTEQYKY